ncbi:MAG: right-handed parallel beta-helix repeat-containing protein, partial [Chitinophagaceae bacterium]
MKFFLIIIALLGIQNTYAKNYYFSSASGDDNRSSTLAQNPATPWKTLTKLNAIFSTLTPGDNIFFNRGETFFGSITVNKSGTLSAPITLSAYGAGANPEITGFTSVSNWYSLGNGIWETYAPSLGTQVNMLTISGTEYAMGRYPNSDAPNNGYFNYESHVTNTSITDYQLSSYPNWTGAEVVIRNQRSVLDRALIIAHSGNTLYYNSSVDWPATDAFGYFIQNDIRTLDQYGEWSYNASSKKLAVFFGTGGPAGDVKASVVNTLVTSKYQNHIVFDNLTLTGSNVKTFDIYYAQNIQIKNCNILFSGTDAIIAADAQNLTLVNNIIDHTNNISIDLEYACDNSIIRYNKILNTGMFHGMGAHAVKGANNSSFRALIVTNSPNTLIEYNEIVNTGYVPISFAGNLITVKNNLISYYAINKDDGGGIYTSNGTPGAADNYGRKIIGNIILNAVGAQLGTNDFINAGAQGIYLDY